jgi:hypothetical protein
VSVDSRCRRPAGRIYEERWLLVPRGGNVQSEMNVIQMADPEAHTLYNCFTLQKPHRCMLLTFAETPQMQYKPNVRGDRTDGQQPGLLKARGPGRAHH